MSIQILEKRVNESYKSPILNYAFLRTGCPTSNSLLYSICLAFKYYRTEMEKNETNCQLFLQQILSRMTIEEWISHTKIENIHEYLLPNWKTYFETMGEKEKVDWFDEERESIQFLELFLKKESRCFELLYKSEFLNVMYLPLDQFYKKWDDVMYKFLLTCIEHLEMEIEKKGDPFSKMTSSHKKKVIFHLLGIWKYFFEEILRNTFQNYIHQYELDGESLEWIVPLLKEFFQINIIIFDSITGKPSLDCMKRFIKPHMYENQYPYILLLYFSNSQHFESLGKQLKQTNRPLLLSRFFSKKDPFIITSLAYLENQFPDIFRKD